MPLNEFTLAERPCIDELKKLGYTYIPQQHIQRDSDSTTTLKTQFTTAITRINNISLTDANDIYQDFLRITDNEACTRVLRGEYARLMTGETNKRTIHLIDFLGTTNNTFTITNQFYVKAQSSRIPDLVIFVNGIPLVVIEAKSPLSEKDKSGEAFEQIKQYERDIPRLFISNAFNLITDGRKVVYGATGSSSQYWAEWKDPYPKALADFGGDHFKMGLYALLEPSRLLDLLAHFIVFETRDNKTSKKICRYHQFRGVNKLVDRVCEGEEDRGLIWHTQGSGKSLTMVFAALKLKAHRTISSAHLQNPNILVLTDRVDLDDQIAKTFAACGLANPARVDSIADLHQILRHGKHGLTVLSTIFKLQGSKQPIADSTNWIILVDECHRTQEKNLGASLRVTFPEAKFFGFTGTPIKRTDKDTYRNFGAEGEQYLDKYGIDDAVKDGATVPIHYVSRGAQFEVDPKELDRAFELTFLDESDEQQAEIKKRGIKIGELVKHPERILEIARDIWAHFKGHAMPKGLKAQIVAFDRETIVLYKRALTQIIAEQGDPNAEAYSACVYSKNQSDDKPSEDPIIQNLRNDLRLNYLDHDSETKVKEAFSRKNEPPYFLLVCNKLLTGFDAPIEGIMYLDSPLREHTLLQAIARTNRVWGKEKDIGLIVDYIGVSKKLGQALSSYRTEDVQHAMRNLEEIFNALKAAHNDVFSYLHESQSTKTSWDRDRYHELEKKIASIDRWFIIKKRIKHFAKIYDQLSPDPRIFCFQSDLKGLMGFIVWATPRFETKVSTDLADVSAKIRGMLEEHIKVSGLETFCKLRKLTDPDFFDDFTDHHDDVSLKEAAIRKASELKEITREKSAESPERYGPFSDLVIKAIDRYQQGQVSARELLESMEKAANGLIEEEKAHEKAGLPRTAHDIYLILESFKKHMTSVTEKNLNQNQQSSTLKEKEPTLSKLEQLALDVCNIYEEAPRLWHQKEQLRRELRGQVRRLAKTVDLEGWKQDIPVRVEEYALRHMAGVQL